MSLEGLKYKDNNLYVQEKNGKVIIKLFISPRLFSELEATSIKQLMDASKLPGVFFPVVGLPDIHEGFGLPIGGVMAVRRNGGVISAGAVGMDINCGVRLLSTDIDAHDISSKFLQELITDITAKVPLGTGKEGKHDIIKTLELEKVLKEGVPYLVDKGVGSKKELERIEEKGCIEGGDISAISKKAVRRAGQLGTLGSGNHFIEICKIKTCYDNNIAENLGINEDKLGILIHSGSRGVGHQVCNDYSSEMISKRKKSELPSKGLAFAYIDSREGQRYYSAMAAASNYAFCNRQLISWLVRKTIEEKIGKSVNISLVYDVSHNIAKFENYNGEDLLVHRKGTTRAFPPKHQGLNEELYEIGQPVIIPGSMGTKSYVVIGTSKIHESFFSVNHGAGRSLSRKKAKESIDKETFKESMKGIELPARKVKKYLDEAPQAYKDIDEVVDTLVNRRMIKKIADMVPMAVLKGD